MAWGVGAPKRAMKKKQITLFSYLMVLIKINHGVATAENYHKYPATPY